MHTLLVVEDDPSLCALMVRTLSAKGYRVLQASDGIEALERLAADPDIELVVTDIVMPRMNGVELAHNWLLRHAPDCSLSPRLVSSTRSFLAPYWRSRSPRTLS